MTSAGGRLLSRAFSSKSVRSFGGNAGWLISERVFTLVVSLATSVWMARYLGSEGFGALNYAIAFVALFGFLPYLGLDGVVTRRLVEEPELRHELLGTTFTLRIGAAILAALLVALTAFFKEGDATTRWMLVIIAMGMIFEPFFTIDFWFQSRMESRYSVRARAAGVTVGALARVTLIIWEAPLVAFAVAVVFQQAVQAAALLAVYSRADRGGERWTFRVARARQLLTSCWPLILSSAGALIYVKIDQVMLGEMVGPSEVGVYAVAARLSEIWYFIPVALGSSLLPILVEGKRHSAQRYSVRLQKMYDAMLWGGILIAVAVTVVALPAVEILYGSEYRGAGLILQLHIWACPAVFIGAVLSRWLTMEDLLIFSLTRHFAGAVMNVLLNLVLIPRYGGAGAAMATVVSYTVASYLACFTDRRTWAAGVMMTRAFTAPIRLLTSHV